MRLLQINTTVNSGSHGRIADEIGKLLISQGHESFIAYGRTANPSESGTIKIGNDFSLAGHLLRTRLFDSHGFGSTRATKKFVENIKTLNPDIIHLHNIHGYYLNIKVLFDYLKQAGKPVVWTFHDCWPFTGHCSHFEHVNCFRWQTGCYHCPNKHGYPASWLIDNSRKNFRQKREIFTSLKKMILVAPCRWMEGHLRNSFLSGYEIRVIYNGIDINKFRPVDSEDVRTKYSLNNKYILGVANIWTKRKGLEDFIKLRKLLDKGIDIVLVGLKRRQCKMLPEGIKGIMRTESIDELAALYSGAEVFVNPTYVDNFPSVNLEALSCGTPVITYNTGGSPESVDEKTGIVIQKGDVDGLVKAIQKFIHDTKEFYSSKCRYRAERFFNKNNLYSHYFSLYQLLKKS